MHFRIYEDHYFAGFDSLAKAAAPNSDSNSLSERMTFPSFISCSNFETNTFSLLFYSRSCTSLSNSCIVALLADFNCCMIMLTFSAPGYSMMPSLTPLVLEALPSIYRYWL